MKDGKHQRYKQGAAVYVEISDGAQPFLFLLTNCDGIILMRPSVYRSLITSK